MKKSPGLTANIFTNPIGWAGTMVGTKLRFTISLIILPLFVLLILDNIATTGIRTYWSSALLLIGYQLMFVFSMRKLYLKAIDSEEK